MCNVECGMWNVDCGLWNVILPAIKGCWDVVNCKDAPHPICFIDLKSTLFKPPYPLSTTFV